ncbi:carboxypeptidase B-like [Mytilus galloprovincialis]|uniref:carboxypeptidase B-like n=1 Tax=Mytilus galloprovincialis TaxID=29158 RepID=UPI003F7C7CD0
MRLILATLLLVLAFVDGVPVKKRRFDGNQVFRMFPKSHEEVKKILHLAKKYDADIWKLPRSANSNMDVHVDAKHLDQHSSDLESIGTDYTRWIDDVQKLIDRENKPVSQRRQLEGFNLAQYHSVSEISQYLQEVATTSTRAELHTAGKSYENKTIEYLKISTGGSKKAIFINGGLHAREWISPAVVLYLINQLALNPNNNPAIDSILEKFDWYLLPVVNPDGYEYSRTTERYWRKNRQPSSSGSCIGVDLNRNFGFKWNPAIGGSTDTCSDVYAGTKALTAPETAAVGKLMREIHCHTIAYLDIHAYGQMWLWPWGYTADDLPSDLEDLKHYATVGANAISNKHNTQFMIGGDATDLYPAAGGADDYAKGVAGIQYSYTVELRDEGNYGFELPANQIVPTGEEMLEGILAFAEEIFVREGL